MKLGTRLALCALLLAGAALCASYTVRDLRAPGADADQPAAVAAAAPAAGYTLCAKNGCVAVLDPESGCAAVVTDIELQSLREADRQLVEAGITVESREELLTLLEDLGS